jgi:hypothetical protein
MRPLSPQETRTIRLATVGISLYLLIFFGARGWKSVTSGGGDYRRMMEDAQLLRDEVRTYENKAELLDKLMRKSNLDPAKLKAITVAAEANAAIQKAATGGGIALGPIRESQGSASTKELASIQVEGQGPVPAVMAFLHRLDTLGYPLVIDSLQLTPQQMPPGNLKFNMTIIILDFEQWKKPEAAHV